MEYRTKIIITGNKVEVYKNKVGIRIGSKRNKKKRKKRKPQEGPKKLNEFAIYRCRREIKWRINSNPEMNKFLTLTFAENRTDLKSCNKELKAFIRKLKVLKDNIKYIAVPEFQKRGAVHYHILINLDYIDQNKIAQIWGHGFIRVNSIDAHTNIGMYVVKYIGKDMSDERYFNNKKYFCSRNLAKPTILHSPNILDIKSKCPNFNFLFQKVFQSYYGSIKYELFEVDNKEKDMIE